MNALRGLALGLLLSTAAPSAAAPTVTVHRDGVRFDLATGAALDGQAGDAAPLAAPILLRAARDEVVAFQLVLSGAPGSVPIAIEAAPGLEVVVLSELGVKSGARLYPDALVPTSSVVVPPAPAVAALWVDVWATPAARPGVVPVVIRVGDGEPVRVEVEVLDLTLGPLPGFGARAAGVPWSEDKLRSWARLLHAHGVDLEVEPRDDASRAVASGRAFAEGYQGPRAGVPPLRAQVPLPPGASADLEAWIQAIQTFTPGPTGTEWVVSAPPITDAAGVARTQAWGQRLAALPPEVRRRFVLRVSDAFGRGFEGLTDDRIAHLLGPVVDEWLITGSVRGSPWNVLELRREEEHDEKLLFRSGPDAGPPATPTLTLDVDLAHARAWGWIVHAYGLHGAIVDGLDALGDCRSEPPCGGARPLESALVWRGEDLGRETDRPYASMRLKALRRGAQDAALLTQLDLRDANTSRALTDIMVASAMGDEQVEGAAPAWSLSAVQYDRARDQILDRLVGAGTAPIAAVRPEIPVDPVRRYGGWPVVLGSAALILFLIVRGAARASRT